MLSVGSSVPYLERRSALGQQCDSARNEEYRLDRGEVGTEAGCR